MGEDSPGPSQFGCGAVGKRDKRHESRHRRHRYGAVTSLGSACGLGYKTTPRICFSPLLLTPRLSSSTMAFTGSDICKIIFAIILPPLGVFLERGCGADLLINILLTLLGYIPGIIHALYIILKY
ncbi:hypothetical protein BJ322DRAFT_295577 [Thelephora terrestris]|uniref:Plasma membrane proteolipid 3 n=1 Tax=Thelephora terrestris TaxID=56493 RepID=A0A9P6H6F9_9AGAM|nr:hypothetical protein BJ322DRAFT_295577 [Thelephora terrestris]